MKKLMPFIISALLIATMGVIMFLNMSKEHVVLQGNFNLSDYQEEIEHFSSDKHVGNIDSAQMAAEKAKELWIEQFSRDGQKYKLKGKVIIVAFDEENECWLIKGTLPQKPNLVGGVPCALIQRDGTVMAVWHGQ